MSLSQALMQYMPDLVIGPDENSECVIKSIPAVGERITYWNRQEAQPDEAAVLASFNADLSAKNKWIDSIGVFARLHTNAIVQWYPDGERDSWTVLAQEATDYITARDDGNPLTEPVVGPYMQAEIDATVARGVPMDADTLAARVQANASANQAALAAMKGARTAAIVECEEAYAGTLVLNSVPVSWADYVATYTPKGRFEAFL